MSALKVPAADYLPPNVSLETMDVFGDVPENLVGRFDIVHIHTFCVVVKNGDPVLLLRHLIGMLSEFSCTQAQPRNLLAFHKACNSSASKDRVDTGWIHSRGRDVMCVLQCAFAKRAHWKRERGRTTTLVAVNGGQYSSGVQICEDFSHGV